MTTRSLVIISGIFSIFLAVSASVLHDSEKRDHFKRTQTPRIKRITARSEDLACDEDEDSLSSTPPPGSTSQPPSPTHPAIPINPKRPDKAEDGRFCCRRCVRWHWKCRRWYYIFRCKHWQWRRHFWWCYRNTRLRCSGWKRVRCVRHEFFVGAFDLDDCTLATWRQMFSIMVC